MLSKLETILKILCDDDNIEVMVSKQPQDYLKEQTQIINVCVAPKTPILTLEDFKQLIGSIQLSIEIKAELKPSSGGYTSTPKYICFDEILGKTTIRKRNILNLKDEFSLERFGGANENIEWKETIERKIFIRLFLNIELARNEHRKYQANPVFETKASLLGYHRD